MLVKIISSMLRNTYTTDDLVERLALMRAYYAKRLFSEGEHARLRDVVGGMCDEETLLAVEAWQTAFREDGISPLVVYEALDAIEEDLEGMPYVTLYVPVRFTADHVVRFGTWFRENVQPNILLTLRTDPRVGGGCALIWNDVYHDLSLRYHIAQHKDAIISMFNSHTHAV